MAKLICGALWGIVLTLSVFGVALCHDKPALLVVSCLGLLVAVVSLFAFLGHYFYNNWNK